MDKSIQKSDDILLGDVFRILWKGRFTILAVTAVFLLAAFYKAQTAVPQYKAVSRFIVKSKTSAINPQIAGLASLIGGKASTAEQDPSLFFPYIVNDDAFLEKLMARKWVFKGDSVRLESIFKLHPDTTAPDWRYRYQKDRLSELRDRKAFRLSKEPNNLLVLETYMPDAKLTYDFNMYMIELLDDYVVRQIRQKASENRKFVEARVADVTEEMKRNEDQVVLFKQNNFDVRAPKVYMEMLRLEQRVAISREVYLQLRKELELAKIEEYKDQPLVELINAPVIPVDRDSPRKTQMMILGLLAGGFIGILLVLARRFLFARRTQKTGPTS